MRRAYAILIAGIVGCHDPATVGGLCPGATCISLDASSSECVADDCGADAGASDSGSVCADGASPLSVDLVPSRVDLLLVFDDGAALVPWLPAMHDEVIQILQQPGWDGIGLGVQRFDEDCDAQTHVNPIVPIAPLPGNASAIEAALPTVPTLSTSKIPALDGALQHARAWANSHAEARVAVVLLTDASPGSCDGFAIDYEAELERIARDGYEGAPSIKTYVIGLGMFSAVDTTAAAGGTEAIRIELPMDGAVLSALNTVRRFEQSCALKWPYGWAMTSSSEVVVSFTDGTERRYTLRDSAVACGDQEGFYIDDSAVIACPRSCEAIATAQSSTLTAACRTP